MRALVTGGTGFIGANLVAGLNVRGIEARILRRESSSLLALQGLAYESAIGDILDSPPKLAEAMDGCDWVFHVAGVAEYWRAGKEWIYKVNVEGTKKILAAAQTAQVNRLVFTSSLAAMGLPERGQLLDESSTFNLKPDQMPYGHSKHLAEIEVRRAVDEGLEAVIVNPTVVLGPRDVNLISGSIIVEAANGLAKVYPPGGVNYVSVEDVVAGHIAAAERGCIGERYILAGENLTHKTALRIVSEVVGRKPPIIGLPKWSLPLIASSIAAARKVFGNTIPFDDKQVLLSGELIFADGSKAIQSFNLPQSSFKSAVQNTYDWYNKNRFLD
jgi:dihydroflavonol-4-reductase